MNPNVSNNAKYSDLVIQTSLIELKENIDRVYIYGIGKYNDTKKFITWQFDKPVSHSIKTLVVDADVYLKEYRQESLENVPVIVKANIPDYLLSSSEYSITSSTSVSSVEIGAVHTLSKIEYRFL